MPTFNPLDANQWRQWVQDFDNTATLFAQQFATLQRLAPYVQQRHPELLPTYNNLLARGATHQVTISTLNNLRQQVTSWLNSIGQFISNTVNAANADINWLKQRFGLAGMGFAPVVAIVGIAAAAAALIVIANWIKESFELSQRLNALQNLESAGQTPENASRIVNQTVGAPGASGNFFGLPLNYLIIGALVLVLGPPILNLLTARERRT